MDHRLNAIHKKLSAKFLDVLANVCIDDFCLLDPTLEKSATVAHLSEASPIAPRPISFSLQIIAIRDR